MDKLKTSIERWVRPEIAGLRLGLLAGPEVWLADRSGGPPKDCLRVTIGTPEQNRAFLDALRATLAWANHR